MYKNLIISILVAVYALSFVQSQNQLSNVELNSAVQNTLNMHNYYRSLHQCRNLKLNDNLSKIAQLYALKLASTSTFEHSESPYGENLYRACSSPPLKNYTNTGADATTAWYNEIKDYNFETPSFNFRTGHFTQVIWKSSSEIGIGIAIGISRTRKIQCVYIVANYDPPGNYNTKEQFRSNVLLRRAIG